MDRLGFIETGCKSTCFFNEKLGIERIEYKTSQIY